MFKKMFLIVFSVLSITNSALVYNDASATGANDGTSPTDAYTSPQSSYTNASSGDSCLFNGSFTIDAMITANGNSNVKYIGVNSSWEIDGSNAVFLASSIDTIIGGFTANRIWHQNIVFKKATIANVSLRGAADTLTFYKCCFDSSSNGIYGGGGSDYVKVLECLFSGNTTRGMYYVGGYSNVINSVFMYNSTAWDIENRANVIAINNLFINAKNGTIFIDGTGAGNTVIRGNLFDGYGATTTTGINGLYDIMITENQFINLTTGIVAGSQKAMMNQNTFYGNTTNISNGENLISIGNNYYDVGDDDGIVDRSTNKYNRKPGAVGRDSIYFKFTEE
jgi:hypothetical protein